MSADSVVISASAGTGKTFSLTNRYLSLLASGVPAGRIVALTFTRKAAGEILSRIVERLCKAASDDRALDELRVHTRASLTRSECHDIAASIARSIHELRIGTIDSFFLRLVRGAEDDVGLPPRWSVTVSPEVAGSMRREALRRTFESLDEEHKRLLRESIARGPTVRIFARTRAVIDSAAAALSASGANRAAWAGVGCDVARVSRDEFDRAVESLSRAPLPLTKADEPNANWSKAVERTLAGIAAGELDEVASGTFVLSAQADGGTYSRVRHPQQIEQALRTIGAFGAREELDHIERKTLALYFVAGLFLHNLDAVSLESGVFDNSQVTTRLARSEADVLLGLYYGLDARVDHLLIDEFQDTSTDQFTSLYPLVDEILSGDERSLLLVGDAKQSLYMWRDAEPSLLPAIPIRWPGVVSESLTQSRRSARAVIDAVNLVFGSPTTGLGLPGADGVRDFADAFSAHDTVKEFEGCVCLRETPDAEESSVVSLIAQRVEQIRAAGPDASIGVLLRRSKHIPSVMHELKRRGIRASAEGGGPVTDSPAASAAVSLLRLIDSPRETSVLFHVATSPIGPAIGIALDTPTPQRDLALSACRVRMAEHGTPSFLHWLLGLVASKMSERDAERFEQLIDLAVEYEASPPGVEVPLWEAAAQRLVEPTGAGGVRVMSIHKSKGLEFDAVVLADLDTQWSIRAGDMLVERLDPLRPASRVSAYMPAWIDAYSREAASLRAGALRRHVYGELCCLYVGMTRARRVLEMIVNPAPRSDPTSLSSSFLLRRALAGTGAQPPVLYQTPGASVEDALKGIAREAAPDAASSRRVMFSGLRPTVARVKPSAAGLAQISKPHPNALGDSRAIGELWHAWLEQIEWSDDATLTEASLLDVSHSFPIPPDVAANEARAFLRAITSGPICELLSRRRYAQQRAHVYRELPFFVIENNRTVRGRIDRVVVCDGGSRAEVIDFKTGTSSDPLSHRAQVDIYREAVARLFGIDAGGVDGVIAFVRAGEVVRIT